jgi:hypothetical protein
MMDDGSDIFAAAYLLARPNIQQDLAHHRARDLARRLADAQDEPAAAGDVE